MFPFFTKTERQKALTSQNYSCSWLWMSVQSTCNSLQPSADTKTSWHRMEKWYIYIYLQETKKQTNKRNPGYAYGLCVFLVFKRLAVLKAWICHFEGRMALGQRLPGSHMPVDGPGCWMPRLTEIVYSGSWRLTEDNTAIKIMRNKQCQREKYNLVRNVYSFVTANLRVFFSLNTKHIKWKCILTRTVQ